jgi:SNF2 family DNA or RNA helicase
MQNLSAKKYIEKYAQPESITKGRQIYNMNGVLDANYNFSTGVWTIEVQGTYTYKVKIWEGLNLIAQTSCSCPYDWGGICKHTVAALLHVDAHHNGMAPKTALNRRHLLENESGTFYKLDDYQKVERKILDTNLRYYYVNPIKYNWIIIKTENKLTFNCIENNRISIKIIKNENDVFIQGLDYLQAEGANLSQYEYYLLKNVVETNQSDIFYRFFNNFYDEFEKKTLLNYKLKGKVFNDYFQFLFTPAGQISIAVKEKHFGLLPADIDKSSFVQSLVAGLSASEKKITLPEAKEERILGFIIDYQYEISVIPMIGNLDKKRLNLNKIEVYETALHEKYKIEISPSQNKIIQSGNTVFKNFLQQYKKFIPLFEALAKEKFVYFNTAMSNQFRLRDLQTVNIINQEPILRFIITEDDQFIFASIVCEVMDKRINLNTVDYELLNTGILKTENSISFFSNIKAFQILLDSPPSFKIVKERKSEFLQKFIKPISSFVEIDFSKSTYDWETHNIDFSKKQIYLSENNEHLIIKPAVVYKDKPVYLSGAINIIEESDNKVLQLNRNIELEKEFLIQIADLHPDFSNQIADEEFYIHYDEFLKNNWFFRFFEHMQKNHVEVYGLKELRKFKYSPFQAKVNTQINSGQDWFDIRVNISFGNENIRLQDIRQAIVNNRNYIILKDGTIGILPEIWIQKLEKYLRHGKIDKDELKISKLKFSIINELFENIDNEQILAELAQKRAELAQFEKIENIKLPIEIKAQLRHYQKEGYNWLHFLDKFRWGGILADDMGLGKTLQILTFLRSIVKINKKTNLIIVPTTLLFNWQKEIEKFTPDLKAFYHYGAGRMQNTDMFDQYDIVFTTYGTLLRDIEFMKNYPFNYQILDESQAIKNPLSMRYKVAALILAENRIALTGTPIENSTFDLYAQLNFVNPGIFGSVKDFKTNYSNAIDINRNEEIARELQKVINPFVLRRTKEQVAKELPPKVENVIYCEMGSEQRRVYDAYKNEYREKLLRNIEKEGINKSKLMILEALTRLRQICDSPALLKDELIATAESIKIKEIINHITEKTAKHKILIFSQFVSMLALIENELDNLNIAYEYLDGKNTVQEREKSVNNFQNNIDLRVFLISLKAGGTGLNLTSADYVYIVDPWWNPAVENQAIDRTYRIGQDKHVFAYRMVCKDTIEEKILKLQEKKKHIADEIIQTDENILKTINLNDLKDFLE